MAYLSVDYMHLGPIVVIDASKLQANVATANNSHLFGQTGQVEHLIGDDGMLSSIDGQLDCPPSCGYQNSLCLQAAWASLVLCFLD